MNLYKNLYDYFRVHCVNVLKVIFSNSILTEQIILYTEKAFEVCFYGFQSSVWSIRNAYCQLFSSLIRRIFGVSKSSERTFHVKQNKKSAFEFFNKFN